MFVLVMSLDEDNQEFLVEVSENEIGEIAICTTYAVEDAMTFETEEDAREFKRDYRLRVWIHEL